MLNILGSEIIEMTDHSSKPDNLTNNVVQECYANAVKANTVQSSTK